MDETNVKEHQISLQSKSILVKTGQDAISSLQPESSGSTNGYVMNFLWGRTNSTFRLYGGIRDSAGNNTLNSSASDCPERLATNYTRPSIVLPEEGSGQPFASACNEQHLSWLKASSQWYEELQSAGKTVVTYIRSPSTYLRGTYEGQYTLCDGFTRVIRSPTLCCDVQLKIL